MSFLDRFKVRPRTAPTDELRAQREEAEAALDAARAAVEKAKESFDESGSDAAAKALAKAEAECERVRLHFQRAERLEQAAIERDKAEERARQEAKLKRLTAELKASALAEAEAPLVAREAELRVELARVLLQREEFQQEISRKETTADTLRVALGGVRRTHIRMPRTMSYDAVAQRMPDFVREDDPNELRLWLNAVEPTRESYKHFRGPTVG